MGIEIELDAPLKEVQDWQKEYFGIWLNRYWNAEENFDDFLIREIGVGTSWELVSSDDSRGYTFVSSVGDVLDPEKVREQVKESYVEAGREIGETFTDQRRGVSGFYWRRPA